MHRSKFKTQNYLLPMQKPIQEESLIAQFLRLESAGGILIILAAILAIILANTPLEVFYQLLLSTPVEVRIGALEIAKPLLLWINDGLMAIFFFFVGLELKREFIEGELSTNEQRLLPAVAAVGGIIMPGLIYAYFNYDDPVAIQGWAIPTATDIAFSLAVLTLLGSRVPIAIKILLTSIAIFDDIGAITIIALFYTEQVSVTAIVFVVCCVPILYVLNKKNICSKSPYILIGVIMWIATLKSGVHATLAGVVLAMFIPIKSNKNPEYSPLKSMENDLHTIVVFFVLPIFAFANSGLNLQGISLEQITHSVPLGISLGLVIGKPIGILLFSGIFIALGLIKLPADVSLKSLFGISMLCGVGFTMSLFIGSLAFEETGVNLIVDERLGIIIGSIISGTIGYLVLYKTLPKVSKYEQ